MFIKTGRKRQEVFNDIYECFERGEVLSIELKEEGLNHGLRIELIENSVNSLREDDCEDE